MEYTKKEIIKNWRKYMKSEFEDWSSLDFQKRVWIDKLEPNMIWEWGGGICEYFDTLRLNEKPEWKNEGIDYHVREGRLTHEEGEVLRPFNEAFQEYADKSPDYPTPEEYKHILSDPEWIKITEMAKDVLKKIDFDTLPGEKKKTKPSKKPSKRNLK